MLAGAMSAGVLNAGMFLAPAARRWPDRPGLFERGRSWSWSQLDDNANALAHGLTSHGLQKGDRVMIVTPNTRAYIEGMSGIPRAGGVYVPINARATPQEILDHAALCDARYALANRSCVDRALADALLAHGLRHIYWWGDEVAPSGPRITEYDSVLAKHRGKPKRCADVAYGDPAWHPFSSGTTGRPKGSVTSHGAFSYILNNRLADVVPGLDISDSTLTIGPLTHGTGPMAICCALVGAPIHIPPTPNFDPHLCWKIIAERRITTIFTVPTMLVGLIDAYEAGKQDASALKRIIYTGSAMPANYMAKALEHFAGKLIQYYGAGEFMGLGTVLTPEMHMAARRGEFDIVGCLGVPRTGTDLAIMSDEMREVPTGEEGEICVRGPGMATGYYKNEAAQAESFRDGWFRTGDLGRVGPGGRIYVVGRSKDILKSGGMQVAPKEIEDLLVGHPDVIEACVVGLADDRWGERIVAVLVLAEGAGLSPEQARQHLRDQVAAYKIPKEIHLWTAIPKTSYGKVDRKLVRQKLMAATSP